MSICMPDRSAFLNQVKCKKKEFGLNKQTHATSVKTQKCNLYGATEWCVFRLLSTYTPSIPTLNNRKDL